MLVALRCNREGERSGAALARGLDKGSVDGHRRPPAGRPLFPSLLSSLIVFHRTWGKNATLNSQKTEDISVLTTPSYTHTAKLTTNDNIQYGIHILIIRSVRYSENCVAGNQLVINVK